MKFKTGDKTKIIGLVILTLAGLITLSFADTISQHPAFHNFRDHRIIFGIPNAWNVLSNLPFLFIGILGIYRTLNYNKCDRQIPKIIALTLCIGILLTGLGSAYYHWHPDNQTLVWDRIPMTIIFMSFLCATIAERINRHAGKLFLFPLILIGIDTVLYWHHTESAGAGDLRWYLFIQFYPMILIPLIIFLFPINNRKTSTKLFSLIITWYIIAKLCEHFDAQLYVMFHVTSGHSLKHLAAAMSTFYIVRLITNQPSNSQK